MSQDFDDDNYVREFALDEDDEILPSDQASSSMRHPSHTAGASSNIGSHEQDGIVKMEDMDTHNEKRESYMSNASQSTDPFAELNRSRQLRKQMADFQRTIDG